MRQQQRKAQREVEEGEEEEEEGQRKNRCRGARPRKRTIPTGRVAWSDRTHDSQHGVKAEGGQGRHSQCPCLRRLLLPSLHAPHSWLTMRR